MPRHLPGPRGATRTKAERQVLAALATPATTADLLARTGYALPTIERALVLLRAEGAAWRHGERWRRREEEERA